MVPSGAHQFDAKRQLTRDDIKVYNAMLIVSIKWSKTRQFGYLHGIPISAISKSCLCSVQAYKNMLSYIPATANDPAFCVKNAVRSSHLLLLSKTLRQLISLSERDEKLYSSHSQHKSGCSCAFKSNVKFELIQQHGDWLSDCYIILTYDFNQKLSVSRKNGLQNNQ